MIVVGTKHRSNACRAESIGSWYPGLSSLTLRQCEKAASNTLEPAFPFSIVANARCSIVYWVPAKKSHQHDETNTGGVCL
jgi:hypothetical protein